MNFRKVYLIFHSYELIAMLWIAIYAFSLSGVWAAMAIGITQHLAFDQILNPVNTFTYFLTYRILRSFKKESLLIPQTRE